MQCMWKLTFDTVQFTQIYSNLTATTYNIHVQLVRINHQHINNEGSDRRPTEGVETTSWTSSTNMAAYNRERPQTTEPGLPGTERMTVNCGVKSWKWQRSSRGKLNDDESCQSDHDNKRDACFVYGPTMDGIAMRL